MNVPNFLSLLRIILIPIFICLLIYDLFKVALCIFIVAILSDAFDGLIAKIYGQKTALGAYLDPMADKLLLTSSFAVLTLSGFIPSWLTVMVISRDVLIFLGVIILFLTSIRVEIKPSLVSKANTVLQSLTILGTLIHHQMGKGFPPLKPFIMATAILTVISGLHYIYRGMEMVGREI